MNVVVVVVVVFVVIVVANLATAAVVVGRPCGSVSVQRLRAAEQSLVAVGDWSDAAVVTPVGVFAVVTVVAVVAAVGVPSLGRFRFLTVFILPIGVRLTAVPAARELAHQPPERFAERFLPLLFAVSAVFGRRSRVCRKPRLLVHLFRSSARRRRPVAGPPFGFRRIIWFRFWRHCGRRFAIAVAVRRSPPALVP